MLLAPTALRNLPELLEALDAEAPLVHRHLWLAGLLAWIRGDAKSVEASVARLGLFLDALAVRPALAEQARACWQQFWSSLDMATLLADHGFAQNHAFLDELGQRLSLKLLPATPETHNATELFDLVFCHRHDARWIAALDARTLDRLAHMLPTGTTCHGLTYGQSALLDALTYCASQARATGFAPALRLRMSAAAQLSQPFHALAQDVEQLRTAFESGQDLEQPLQNLRDRLDLCRQCAATVYTHLDEHGISVDLVFSLRQLRERLLRLRALLDCLTSADTTASAARLCVQLVTSGHDRRSLRMLVATSTSLLAAKVTERSSETGEQYIARSRAELLTMFGKALGGGTLTALTTWLKFLMLGLALSPFWGGFWTGVMYAASFAAIGLLHWTLATKQPALTAPALAARLKGLDSTEGLDALVDEVSHLVRSQLVAVLGNVLAVVPVVLLGSLLLLAASGQGMLGLDEAHHVLQSLSLRGPTLLFAAFTGVLLFTCSLIAGWAENWFVLHRLHSALRYNPRITGALGVERARRVSDFMRAHVSSLASNISLGLMLGLAPAVAQFFGIALEVRHVTLSAGQLAAAGAALGWGVLALPAFWWCAAAIPLIGAVNLGVSFYLALRLALAAQNVTGQERTRIRKAIWLRWRTRPSTLFMPGKD